MSKINILCYAIGVLLTGVALAVALPVAQESWRNNEYVKGLIWSCFVGVLVIGAILAGGYPFAVEGDAASKKGEPDSAERALRHLAEQTALQTRPYIDVLGASLDYLAVGNVPSARVTIKNSGRTPAVDVMVGSRLQIGDFPLFTDTAYEAIDGPRISIGADGQAVIPVVRDNAPMTETEWAGIKSGMRWLKVHGEIVFTSDPPPSVPYKHVHFCFVLNTLASQFLQVCDNFGGDHADKGVFR